MGDIFEHKWVKKINVQDIISGKIKPPLSPNPLGFNFDEQDFNSGELEFRRKLINCQLGKDVEDLPTIFNDFYYDCNVQKMQAQK